MIEEWRDVVGYEGRYRVSNEGRVEALLNVKYTGKGKEPYQRKLFRKPTLRGSYLSVAFYANGKDKRFAVHRLVASAFIPNPSNLPCVNHKNGIKSDCSASNLEWVTHKQNKQHALDTGLAGSPFDNEYKIAYRYYLKYNSMLKKGERIAIAIKLGIKKNVMWNIVKGCNRKKHIMYPIIKEFKSRLVGNVRP